MDETTDLLKDAKFYAIDAISLNPTDTIIVTYQHRLDLVETEYILSRLKVYFPDNPILVFDMGAEIKVARKE